jgi:hypothetical protein
MVTNSITGTSSYSYRKAIGLSPWWAYLTVAAIPASQAKKIRLLA